MAARFAAPAGLPAADKVRAEAASADSFTLARTAEAPAPETRGTKPSAVLSEFSHPWQDETAGTASWSGKLDPGQVFAGSTISVNGVTFQFVDDGPADGGELGENQTVKIDIKDASGAEVAQRFASAVNSREVKAAIQAGWARETDGPAEETEAELCSWEEDEDSGDWTLTLTQPEAWAHDGDRFSVTTGSLVQMDGVDRPAFNESASIKRRQLKNIDLAEALNGFSLRIGGAQLAVRVRSGEEITDVLQWNGGDGGKTSGTLFVDADKLLSKGTTRGSLSYALDLVFSDMGYSVRPINVNAHTAAGGTTFDIVVTGQNGVPPELDIMKPSPQVGETQETEADIGTPAYLQYELDLNQMQNGDSFNFRGYRFEFDLDADASGAYVDGNTVYVSLEGPGDVDGLKTGFQDTFNNYFGKSGTAAPSGVTGAASGAGWDRWRQDAAPDNSRQGFQSLLALLKEGAFEMKLFVNGSGKATVSIFAKSKAVLNLDMEIGEEDGEGWEQADEADEAGETDGEAGETGAADGSGEASQALEADEAAAQAAPEEGADMVEMELKESAEAVSSPAAAPAGEPPETEEPEAAGDAPEAGGEAIGGADEAKAAVADTAEQIAQEPGESLEAQSAELERQAVKQLVVS